MNVLFGGSDEKLLDRFLARQRAEIVARIRAERSAARTRYALAGLAASLLLVVSVSLLALRSGPPDAMTDRLSFWSINVSEAPPLHDPLEAYGSWRDDRSSGLQLGALDAIALPLPGDSESESSDGLATLFDLDA